ncbi:MAG: phosphate acyltransferase PlsX [Pseudomonas sp.]|nr:phosphate acyltransferase PlsX [Pseudomonas sp.]MDD2222088.1 phosphate acyltransferase PlsX [Pseudomonas sp.]MDY0413390.1 phosphate acyltransferase PlsX [Pseudomonas sp.]NLO54685.1 phosphate acyltransferase PlsX [Gammaproteobacteria bacterium]
MTGSAIAVDAMGGDYGPRLIVSASVKSLLEYPDLHLVLVGDSAIIESVLAQCPQVDYSRLVIQHASESISMTDLPVHALRHKPDSSMRVALQLLRDKQVQACVSAGNTGALMALAKHILNPLPHIDRPAIMTALPTLTGATHLLDLGANVDVSAQQLVQFALMGSAAVQIQGLAQPRVALLNVGREANKGNQQVKLAAAELQAMPHINYIGYVEGDGVFRGDADVVVCDGFVGNVLLKSSEGLAQMIAARIKQRLGRGLRAWLLAWLAAPLLKVLRSELAPERYNGACLLGVDGVVVKSHGNASQDAFQAAISVAYVATQERLVERLQAHLQGLSGT